MYIFDINKIQPFDIVLVRFENDEISKQIRATCSSNYSHAIVYLGNSSFVEASNPIVTLFSLQRYYFPDLNNIKVLRLNDTVRASFNLTKADECIRGLVYCDYSMRLLVYIKARNISSEIKERFIRDGKWTGGVVCTSLISLSLFAGGFDISGNKEPYYAHFGDIEKSNAFVDVTQKVFKEVPKVDSEGVFDYFSVCETGSILEKQSQAVCDLNALVVNIYNDLRRNRDKYIEIRTDEELLAFSNWEDIFPNLMRWFNTSKGKEIDLLVYNEIKRTEYDNLWFIEVHNNPRLFFPTYYLNKKQMSSKESLTITRDSLKSHLERMEKAKMQCLKIFKVSLQNFSYPI